MGAEQRAQRQPGFRLDRLRFPWQGPRPVQEPTAVGQPIQAVPPSNEIPNAEPGDMSGQVVRRARKKEGREFFDLGGTISREADLAKDIDAINALYLQLSAIEHLADVTPKSAPKDLKEYYRTHPDSQLLVAELNGEVVGAITIAPEEGLYSVKLNRLVRREDKPGLGIAHHLIGEAIVKSFLKKTKGGKYQAASITIGVILDVDGADAARKAFKDWGFKTQDERDEGRCNGWSKEQARLVPRAVEIMKLKYREFAFNYGSYLNKGTSLPTGKTA